jgi:acetyltransferase-like isoleucine patch superfamily enzyme
MVNKIINAPLIIFRDVLMMFIINMPGGFGIKLRYLFYKNKLKKCGKNVRIEIGVHFEGLNLISLGDNVFIDKYCIISTGKNLTGKVYKKPNNLFSGEEGEILIGNNIHIVQFCILMGYGGLEINDNCVLSSGCKIYSLTNTAYDLDCREVVISLMPYSQAPFLLSPVYIGSNTWLGLNSIVMPSVCLGKNSFSTSNSVLMSNFAENSYITGNPAKSERRRFEKKIND